MRYFRLSGGGNDFIALAEPDAAPSAEVIRALCTRGLSLGADGLFLLHREENGVRMTYFNADGGPAELCLNGTRCAARLAFHLGWAQSSTTVTTGAGPVAAEDLGDGRVRLELPALTEPPRELTLDLDGTLWEGFRLPVGVPHLVLLWDDELAGAPVAEIGSGLRHHPALAPEGVNVNFSRTVDPHRLELRTYERGVEAETLACGTGAIASVAIGLLIRRVELPVTVLTRGGFELEVDGLPGEAPKGRRAMPSRWHLAGDARVLSQGETFPEATAVPIPPDW